MFNWEVRTEKYFPDVSETARDQRALLRPKENIFQRRRTLTFLFVFLRDVELNS